MTSKERLTRQVLGQEIDRVPCLGGWIGGVRNLAELAGLTVDEYLANPLAGVIKAHRALGVDGMVMPNVPDRLDQIRSGEVLDSRFAGVEPEALVEAARQIPDSEKEVLATFHATEHERQFRDTFEAARANGEGMEPIPNFWDIGGHFPLYFQYGYSAFLFTSNVTGVEVPPENLRAAYAHVQAWDPRQPRTPTRRRWPGTAAPTCARACSDPRQA